MSSKYLSFDIGARNIRLVEGFYKGDTVEILKEARIEIPRGTVNDSFIIDKKELNLAMQEAISKLPAATKNAIVTINSSSVFIREFEVPAGDEKELDGMVKNEIAQYYGVSDTDLVEYKRIAGIKHEGMKKVKIRAAVMNKEIAADYYHLLNSLRLKPIALDIHPNVISKVFTGQFAINGEESGQKNFLLLDIGYAGSVVYCITRGNLDFSRSLFSGGKTIDSLIANLFSITDEEAENCKLSKLKEMTLFDEQNLLWSAVSPLYRDIQEELRKVIQFSLSRSGSRVIHSLYLIGGGAELNGLADYLSQGLGIDVQKLESISRIKFNGKKDKLLGSTINAAGALIRL